VGVGRALARSISGGLPARRRQAIVRCKEDHRVAEVSLTDSRPWEARPVVLRVIPCERLWGAGQAAQFGPGLGTRLSQQAMGFGAAFDRPRLDAVGTMADLMPGDQAELR